MGNNVIYKNESFEAFVKEREDLLPTGVYWQALKDKKDSSLWAALLFPVWKKRNKLGFEAQNLTDSIFNMFNLPINHTDIEQNIIDKDAIIENRLTRIYDTSPEGLMRTLRDYNMDFDYIKIYFEDNLINQASILSAPNNLNPSFSLAGNESFVVVEYQVQQSGGTYGAAAYGVDKYGTTLYDVNNPYANFYVLNALNVVEVLRSLLPITTPVKYRTKVI